MYPTEALEEIPISRGKKKRLRCKVEEASDNKKKAGRDHRDYPISMMALWGGYQARCSGCETSEPVVEEGPWAAQEALYSTQQGVG